MIMATEHGAERPRTSLLSGRTPSGSAGTRHLIKVDMLDMDKSSSPQHHSPILSTAPSTFIRPHTGRPTTGRPYTGNAGGHTIKYLIEDEVTKFIFFRDGMK
jgi:hypothetical protein